MAIGNAADVGYGVSLGSFSSSFFSQITDFSWSGYSRTRINITSMASTNKYGIFLPGDIVSLGQLDVEFNFLTNALAAAKTLMAASKAAITITYPIPVDGGTSAGTVVAQGFAEEFGATSPMDDRMVGTCVICLSGEPTMTDAA